jgi:DNA-binding GntR family transcriptional regulator
VHARLRSLILSGELVPGDRLVERHVAELAGVSRTPVREALKRLERDGLVRSTSGGAEVLGVSLDDLVELATVRETLEALAGQLAARAATEADLLMLEQIVAHDERTLAAGGEAIAHVELNHRFHQTIWRASRNRYLAGQLGELRDRVEGMQRTTLVDPQRRREAIEEHRAIVDALKQRDPDATSRFTRDHFRYALVARIAALSARRDTDATSP